jgi:hypothetical protein
MNVLLEIFIINIIVFILYLFILCSYFQRQGSPVERSVLKSITVFMSTTVYSREAWRQTF